MVSKPSILIATTRSDNSLRFFLEPGIDVVYFDDELEKFSHDASRRNYDVVYIRDPFNTGRLAPEDIIPYIDVLGRKHQSAYFVDCAHRIAGVLIEDKWNQYEIWQKWMPQTRLGDQLDGAETGVVAKKRISARSRDILFELVPEVLSSDWIVQERLDIVEELRVYALFGRVVRRASIRRSKSATSGTKVVGLRDIAEQEVEFAEEVVAQQKQLDFVGLDIVVTPTGLRLIEVNRSPQLNRYNELAQTNLVANFWDGISERIG